MKKSPSSSAEQFDTVVRPVFDAIERAIQELGRRSPADLKSALALRLVRLALQQAKNALEHALTAAEAAELAEAEAVYRGTAEQLAATVAAPVADVYPAVLAICGESDDPRLMLGVAPARPELVAALKREVIRIKAIYRLDTDNSVVRELEIYRRGGEGQAVKTSVQEKLSRDQLPGDVRGSLLESGAQSAGFTLFPGSR